MFDNFIFKEIGEHLIPEKKTEFKNFLDTLDRLETDELLSVTKERDRLKQRLDYIEQQFLNFKFSIQYILSKTK